MTRGQRSTWLALEAQKRRRNRLPAILLTSDGHGHLTWTINFTSPWDSINIYQSVDGVTWGTDAFDGWDLHYLGTCYLESALYKTQFAGAEFFNGFRWSSDLKELKYILRRDKKDLRQHLLETDGYRDEFYKGDLGQITAASEFRVKVK